jgi:hypothetical protein
LDLKKNIMILAVLVMVFGIYGCPLENTDPKVDTTLKAGPEVKLAKLDILYEILLKDHPPQNDTIIFRQKMAEARSATQKGNDLEAQRLADEAEKWILEARSNYYKKHLSDVNFKNIQETPEELYASSQTFKNKALTAQSLGNEWAAKQYYQASIEQGELSLVASKLVPVNSRQVIKLAEDLEVVYKAADRMEEGKKSKEVTFEYIKDDLARNKKEMERRLSGEARGFDTRYLGKCDKTLEAYAKLNSLNAIIVGSSENAEKYAPDHFRKKNYSADIATWRKNWEDRCSGKAPTDDPWKYQDKCVPALSAHNSEYKTDAEPASGTGILLKENDVYVRGDKVFIRGQIQNNRTEPIYNPRITVAGGVMSDVKILPYKTFTPLTTTTFELQLDCFNSEAFYKSGDSIPKHDIVVIFNESTGVVRKVFQRIK